MLCAPVSDSNPALMMASTTSRTHRPFSSRSLASPSCCFSLPFETTTRRLESNMHRPCGMLLIAVSKRLASSDMSREEMTASSSVLRSRSAMNLSARKAGTSRPAKIQ